MIRSLRQSLDVDSQTYFAILLEVGRPFVDSAGQTRAFISAQALKETKLPDQIPLSIDHSPSVLDRVGFVDNLEKRTGTLVGKLHILKTLEKGRRVLELLQQGLITDVSVEIFTKERYLAQARAVEIYWFELFGLSLVTRGALASAKITK